MKMSAHLTEIEIRGALAEWLQNKRPGIKPLVSRDVLIEIVKSDDDPRAPHGGYVTASISFEE